mmetsp:Transcript_30258/g.73081  ORF Transcript_30258/g.73081 Transcript_30258/m.73081 type:complete len:289 (-) Transcript_30258:298-1164(-)
MVYVRMLLLQIRHQRFHLLHQCSRGVQIVIFHLIPQCPFQFRILLRRGMFLSQLSKGAFPFLLICPIVVPVHVSRIPIDPTHIGPRPNVHLHNNLALVRPHAQPVPSPHLDGLRPLVRLELVRDDLAQVSPILLVVDFVLGLLVAGVSPPLLLPSSMLSELLFYLLEGLALPSRYIRPGRDGVLALARMRVIDHVRVTDDPRIREMTRARLDEVSPVLHGRVQFGPHRRALLLLVGPRPLPALLVDDLSHLRAAYRSLDLHPRPGIAVVGGVDDEHFEGGKVSLFDSA